MAKKKTEKGSSANIGFEAKLWLAADKLRNNMDAAEYKHVVLGLIFLKYISDTFEQHRAKLLAGEGEYAGANPEDQDEYKAENVFWVPKEARWSHLQANAKQPTIGKLVDDAMVAIERDNSRLKGVLPKDYARPALDKHRLGELIDLIGTIVLIQSAAGAEIATAQLPPDAGKGEATGKLETEPLPSHRSVDLLGRVYEYFLTQFASAEGKNGGQFYTPSCVVRVLVEMLAPYKGRIYDPCCGSGGMFVQSEKFVEAHGGKLGDISITPGAVIVMSLLAVRQSPVIPTSPASANPPPSPTSLRMATSSRPAAMSVLRKSKTTANPSRKRCRASSPNCTPSSPSPRNWKRPSTRIWRAWAMPAKKTAKGQPQPDQRLSRGRTREDARFTAAPSLAGLPVTYTTTLQEIKSHLRNARVQAVLAANPILLAAYWHTGKIILQRQQEAAWGAKVIDRLAADLQAEFPDMSGLTRRNLFSMRAFAEAFPDGPIVKQPVSQLPWGQTAENFRKGRNTELQRTQGFGSHHISVNALPPCFKIAPL